MSMRRRPWRGIAIAAWLALASSCECGRDEPRFESRGPSGEAAEGRSGEGAPRDPGATAGGEAASTRGPAVALREPGPEVPAPTRFVRVDTSEAEGHVRARGWARIEDLRAGRPDRMSLGNWLCRIWTHYGPPSEVQEDGFIYAFRDEQTGDVITAYSAGSGPALGGLIVDENGLPMPGAQARVSASVDAFVAMMDATVPRDCALEIDTPYGRTRVGVQGGEWFEEEVPPVR